MNSPYGLSCVESCLSCTLRSGDFFCALSQEFLEAFNQATHAVVLPKGAVIFVQGQTANGVFMLCQGEAQLSTTSPVGRTSILRIARAGEVLGLGAVVTGKPYEVTVETMQACQLNFVNGELFLPFLKQHSDACLRAAQHISRDYQEAFEMIRSIGLSHSACGRLAKFLLASATNGEVKNGVVRARFVRTHVDIGQLTGVSRGTISRILSDFRRKDIAELKGSILIIRNKPALEELVAA